MAISRAQLFKELLPGLNKLFGLEYAKYENEHTMVFSVENSDRSFEEEQKLSGFGAAGVKMEGAAHLLRPCAGSMDGSLHPRNHRHGICDHGRGHRGQPL